MQAAWEWPGVHKGGAVADLFNESRAAASSDTFKAGASEVLLVYPFAPTFGRTKYWPLQLQCSGRWHPFWRCAKLWMKCSGRNGALEEGFHT